MQLVTGCVHSNLILVLSHARKNAGDLHTVDKIPWQSRQRSEEYIEILSKTRMSYHCVTVL